MPISLLVNAISYLGDNASYLQLNYVWLLHDIVCELFAL